MTEVTFTHTAQLTYRVNADMGAVTKMILSCLSLKADYTYASDNLTVVVPYWVLRRSHIVIRVVPQEAPPCA
jgi:hypothetical protein